MTQGLGKNPYRPGVGTRPLHLAGREISLRRFRAMLRAAPELPANMRLTGLRGVGKTVLLGEFQEIAANATWASALLEMQPSHNTDDALVAALTRALQTTRERLSRAARIRRAVGGAARQAGRLGLTWGEFKLTYEPFAETGREDLSEALFEVTKAAVQKGHSGFVLLLDEAQVVRDEHNRRTGEHPLSLLISSVVGLQKSELPLGIVLCGLPTLTGNLLRARSYTERMFRGEEIGSLNAEEAREAFVEPLVGTKAPVQVDDDLVETTIQEVAGYPYFIQLWGAELWDAAVEADTARLSTRLLDAARPYIYQRLDLDFYEPRLSTLTPAEQDVLLATADCQYPPLVVADLNEAIRKSPGNINVLLGRLVDIGVVYRIRKGQYDYTAPKFREFLLRRTGKDQVEYEPEPEPEPSDATLF